MEPMKAVSINKKSKVVVIGSGIAGLTTAYRLQQKGIDVEVYEAKNRIGGRIFTARAGGNIVELGGDDILDGGFAENILSLINELELGIVKDTVLLSSYYFNGFQLYSVPDLFAKLTFTPESLKEKLQTITRTAQNMKEVLDELFGEENKLLKNVLHFRLAAYEGYPLENLSILFVETLYYMILGGISIARENKEHEKNRENHVFYTSVKGGNSLLTEKLASLLSGKIYTHMPLVAISQEEDKYILSFEDDQKIIADILVMAIPCPAYQTIKFGNNVIPEETLTAIKNIAYSANSKILVPLTGPFEKGKQVIDDHMLTFFNADQNTLTLYYTGDASFFSSDTITTVYQKEQPIIALGFEPNSLSPYAPVLAYDKAFEEYKGPVGYSWPNDIYTGGSYSYIAAGQENLLTQLQEQDGETIKSLFAPINNRLYFAGEHTAPLVTLLGTMEGACQSGEITARLIEKHLSMI